MALYPIIWHYTVALYPISHIPYPSLPKILTLIRTRLKTGTKFSGFGTYHFWLVLILAILTSVLHNSDYQQRFVEGRFEDATADILRRINADHGEDEIVPEDEDSNSSSESDMEIV